MATELPGGALGFNVPNICHSFHHMAFPTAIRAANPSSSASFGYHCAMTILPVCDPLASSFFEFLLALATCHISCRVTVCSR